MNNFKKLVNGVGTVILISSLIVYYFSAERTGSLWDCGEFILGAYKLQVVHPPGAPLFMIVGRLFTLIAELFSNNPEDIAFAVNMMSSLCTSLAAMFVGWSTMILGKMALVGRSSEISKAQAVAIGFTGLTAGLATAFSTSVWFSAVEGEVYAMSTFFTALTVWAGIKWYHHKDDIKNDRWMIFALFMAGLSMGVHLLSLLTYPALSLLYYFKRYKNHSIKGFFLSMLVGVLMIAFVQKFIIAGIPSLWRNFEILLVNGLGLPIHTGIIPTVIAIGAIAYFLLKYAHRKRYNILQILTISAFLISTGFSIFGVIVLRANADTPINMNVPDDAVRVLPYLNREQYGERALLYGPHFDAQPADLSREKRYGRVGNQYEEIDEKFDYIYRSEDKILIPRIGHTEPGRPALHRIWYEYLMGRKFRDGSNPGQAYNMKFFFVYQVNWMYWRYFMWNFVGRQNGDQGFYPWDKKNGHWMSGIKFIDEMRLYNMDKITETMKNHKATNTYYFLPLIFGLLGLFFHSRNQQKEFLVLLTLFVITGLGIIFYSNQPPNEPRERDYVLVGSFFTFCMWIGMGVIAIYQFLKDKMQDMPAAIVAGVLVLSAPLIMAFENFDDHSRMHHHAARDYASNFLESCEPNAIIFTYGDNDTYPLWYAQEVENIRTDVRVVNLSLIAVDWYINKLRWKVNESPAIKLTIPEEAYRGKNRNQIPIFTRDPNNVMDLKSAIRFIGEDHPLPAQTITFESFLPARKLFIPVDSAKAINNGIVHPEDADKLVKAIELKFPNKNYLTKDEIAVLDIIASNIFERPIYFATTCKNEKLLGLNDFMSHEGMGFQIVPIKTASDKSLAIYGSGRVDEKRVYRNVMEKFRWGGFDKKDLYIDPSYAAAVQAHKLVMMRACERLISKGDNNKAVAMSDQYFEAFPHFNFPYDAGIMPFIEVYIAAGEFEKAKTQLRILANEAEQNLRFFDSIDEIIVETSFETEYMYALRAVRDVLRNAARVKDPSFNDEMKSLLGPYDITNMKN